MDPLHLDRERSYILGLLIADWLMKGLDDHGCMGASVDLYDVSFLT